MPFYPQAAGHEILETKIENNSRGANSFMLEENVFNTDFQLTN